MRRGALIAVAVATIAAGCGGTKGATHRTAACGPRSVNVATHRRIPSDGAFGPVWSPDGTRIAFSYERPGFTDTAEYVASVNEGRATLVASNASQGQWSPSGRFLVVQKGDAVTVVHASGGGAARALARGRDDAVWSPDGCWIAFEGAGVSVEHPDGSGYRVYGSAGVGEPAFSGNGRELAFSDGGIWIVDLPAGKPRELVEPAGFPVAPVVSPDGRSLAYAMGPPRAGTFFDDDPGGRIYVIDTAGGAPRPVGYGNAPVWSPDGKRLAFMHTDGCARSSIVVVNTEGTHPRTITDGGFDQYPAWSPNGKSIAYSHATQIHGCSTIGEIRIVAAAGGPSRPLLRYAAARKPPRVVGLKLAAAVARLRGRRYRLTNPVGSRPPRTWVVCLERTTSDALGPLTQLLATPTCPYVAPRLIGMTFSRAEAAIAAAGALEDEDPADSRYVKADEEPNWLVCNQDPAPGKRIPLDPNGSTSIHVGIAPHC